MEGITKLSPDARTQQRHFSRESKRKVRLRPFRGGVTEPVPSPTSVVPELVNCAGRKRLTGEVQAAQRCSARRSGEGRWSPLCVRAPAPSSRVIYTPPRLSGSLKSASLSQHRCVSLCLHHRPACVHPSAPPVSSTRCRVSLTR